MRKRLKRPYVVVIVIAAALLFGFFYRCMFSAYQRTVYPQKFHEFVSASAAEFGVPEGLIYAVIKTESNFDPEALSSAGAEGLMQLLPSTFEWITNYILVERLDTASIRNPEINIRYGTCLLAWLHNRYGNWETALAAYNAGHGNVDRWLVDEHYSDGEGGLANIPFAETRRYVEITVNSAGIYEKLYYSEKGDH